MDQPGQPSVSIPATSVDGYEGGACAFPINTNDDNSDICSIPDTDIEDSCTIDFRPISSAEESDGEVFPVTFDAATGKVQFKLDKRE